MQTDIIGTSCFHFQNKTRKYSANSLLLSMRDIRHFWGNGLMIARYLEQLVNCRK